MRTESSMKAPTAWIFTIAKILYQAAFFRAHCQSTTNQSLYNVTFSNQQLLYKCRLE